MIFATIFFALLLLFCPASHAISITTGETAPEFSLASSDGNIVSLGDYKGKTTVLIYWRTDQQRSFLALTDAKEVIGEFKGKDVNVISVIADEGALEEAGTFLKENRLDFPLLIDKKRQLYGDYGIRVYPTSLIIDREGLLSSDIPGHPTSYRIRLKGYIKKALGEIDEEELQSFISPKKGEKDAAMLEATRLYNLALKFLNMRMIEQAIRSAAKSIEAKPDFSRSHILIGYLYMETDEADNALKAFNKALELKPGSKDAKTGKGSALILKGETDSAIELLSEAAVANPYPQRTYYELGKAYESKGENEKSVEMYKKAFSEIVKKHILPSSLSQCQ